MRAARATEGSSRSYDQVSLFDEVKKTGKDYILRATSTFLVARVVGIDPVVTVAYTTAVYIIEKVAHEALVTHVALFPGNPLQQRDNNARNFIVSTFVTGAICLYSGLSSRMALTILSVDILGKQICSIIKYFYQEFKGSWDRVFYWDTIIFSELKDKQNIHFYIVSVIFLATSSYCIAQVSGLNPIAALVAGVVSLSLNNYIDHVRRGNCYRESGAAIQQIVVFAAFSKISNAAFGLSLLENIALLGVNTIAYRILDLILIPSILRGERTPLLKA